MNFIQLILEVLVSKFLYPALMEFARRREVDPAFKVATDSAYGELELADSTASRWKAIRKIHALRKP